MREHGGCLLPEPAAACGHRDGETCLLLLLVFLDAQHFWNRAGSEADALRLEIVLCVL